MNAITKVNAIIGAEATKQLIEAGICMVWQSEYDLLLWAANNQPQTKATYKKLDKLQRLNK